MPPIFNIHNTPDSLEREFQEIWSRLDGPGKAVPAKAPDSAVDFAAKGTEQHWMVMIELGSIGAGPTTRITYPLGSFVGSAIQHFELHFNIMESLPATLGDTLTIRIDRAMVNPVLLGPVFNPAVDTPANPFRLWFHASAALVGSDGSRATELPIGPGFDRPYSVHPLVDPAHLTGEFDAANRAAMTIAGGVALTNLFLDMEFVSPTARVLKMQVSGSYVPYNDLFSFVPTT